MSATAPGLLWIDDQRSHDLHSVLFAERGFQRNEAPEDRNTMAGEIDLRVTVRNARQRNRLPDGCSVLDLHARNILRKRKCIHDFDADQFVVPRP